jgi:basic membrane protein A and related proteins
VSANGHDAQEKGLDRRELLARGGRLAAAGTVGSLIGAPIAFGRQSVEKSVALISTQKAGDRGVVDDMVNWLNKAGKTLGVETKFIQALDPSTYQSTLQATAQAGFGIIASTFPGMQKPLAAVAPSFPDTRFIHIYGDPDKPVIPNLVRVRYAFWEGTFLAGVLAGLAASKPAFVGGEPIPNIIADANAYKLGVARVKKGTKVKVVFSGSGFTDPGKSHDADAGVFAAGYDWIMSDDEQQGPLKAAKEKNKFVMLEEPHFFAEAPKNVPAVVIIKFGESLYGQIKRALGPAFKGGLVQSGVHDKVVGLDISPLFLKQGPPDVAAKVKAAQPQIAALSAQIVSGKVKVPFVPKL